MPQRIRARATRSRTSSSVSAASLPAIRSWSRSFRIVRRPSPAKRELLSKLLYGKVTAITEALAIQAVGRLRTAPADAFDELSALAAALRDKAVAHVRSASTLSSEQVERLAATLTRTYGKPVTVHVEVDPALLSGMVVRVGHEVIDGSAAGRLAALRKTFK